MTTITPELIADVKAKGASLEEIEVLNNQLKEQNSEVGKIKGDANQSVDATSKSATLENTELESENTSSDLQNNSFIPNSAEDNVLPEVKVTPLFEEKDNRASELLKLELDEIFKVYEGKTLFDIRANKSQQEFDTLSEDNISEENSYLNEHSDNFLTGLEEVKDGFKVVGVKRKSVNKNGNQTLTSSELKEVGLKIKRTLEKEDDYIGGKGEGSFNYKTTQKTKEEVDAFALELKNKTDFSKPGAIEEFEQAVMLKYQDVWSREALADEEYKYRSSTIESALENKFKADIINKHIEEEKSFLVPDAYENSGAIVRKLYEFFNYQLPSSKATSSIAANGESMYKISEQLKKAEANKYTDKTKGFIGTKDNELVFVLGKGLNVAGLTNTKAASWKEAKVLLEEESNKYGSVIMQQMAFSREYQEKLATLGTPEILNESWEWDLDAEGYKELLGTQLGQMTLGALTFGGSTFMQELGGMTQEAVSLNAALLHSGIDSRLPLSEEEKIKIQKDFYNLSADKQDELSMEVLKSGMIDFDKFYTSAARSAGLDLVGNFFVIGKTAKLVPKQLVTGFMAKNLKQIYGGLKGVVGRAAGATVGEMLTEGLQNLNSQATVSNSAALHTFDSRGLANETLMASVVPGPLTLVGQSAQIMTQAARMNNMDVAEGSYNAWFDKAESNINVALKNGQIKKTAADKALAQISLSREVLSSLNLKDVKTAKEREIITNSLIKSAEYQTEITELQSKITDTKKQEFVQDSSFEETIEEQIDGLRKKQKKETLIQVKEKAISHYLTNSKKQEHWQNQQTEGVNENRFTKIFKTTKEAKAYILKNFPGQLKKFDKLLTKGAYGTNVQNVNLADGNIGSYNFAITDNVIQGIREGDLTAGNVINHEQAHDNLQNFNPADLSRIRKEVTKEMKDSKDPEIQRVLDIMNRKLKGYSKANHQEFYTAMSDSFHALDMVNLSLDGKTTLSFLGEIYAEAFGNNVGPIVNWKEGFDKLGVVDFIKSYTLMTEDFYAEDVIEGIRGGKEPNINSEDVKKNSSGIYTQDSRRVYPTGRTTEEIKQANSVLAEEMLQEKTNPRYTNEADPALEAKVRAGEMKKLEGELVANNMGLINLFLKHKSNGGLYFDPSAGDINYDDFSEAVMGEVSTIINTYSPYDENGKQQDFGKYLGGLMDRRIPGIWQKLVGDQSKEFITDFDNRQDEQNSDYDDFVNEFDDQIITLGGEDMTVQAATSEMRKTLGIKEGDQLYNEILDDVIEVLITDFEAVNEEGFYLDTKDKIAKKLFKKLKTILGSPGSPKYKIWLNENIEKIYKLLPQSVFNKSYEKYTITEGRANVAQSIDKDVEFSKGVKIKSPTAGNEIRSKVPYTDEIGEQFVLELLDPKKQGLKGTPASKQDGLVTQLGSVIGVDAISTAINSSAFKDAHGDQDAIMGHVADVINRDMSVQFSNKTLGIEYNLDSMVEYQQANKLVRALATSGIVGDQESIDFINKTAAKLGYSMDAAAFVIHLDSMNIIEKGESTKFKSDLTKWLEEYDPSMAIEFKKDGAIKGKKGVLDRIAEDVTKFTGGMDPEMLDALGFDIFAFHRRVLNAAETQEGPKRILKDRKGEIITVQKQNKKFPDGNQSYANATTTLKLEGWTFNQSNNKFVHNEGKLKNSIDPVKDHGAVIVSAPYFKTLQNIKRTNEAKKQDSNYTPTGKYDNVRVMNMGVPGGLFKKIGDILNDKNISTRKARIDKIVELHGPEIEAANKANMELATDISIELIEAVKDDKINTTTFFHMLQSQTNLAYGFRGLTKLQMISVLEGTYKEEGGRAYGEHINPNSSKMLELAKIGMRAKNDPDYNYMEAVAVLFSDHDQVLFTSGDAKTIDTSKLLSGPTSTASYDRLKALTPKQRASFVGYNGESYKEAMVRINATNNILIETAKKKFESQRKVELLDSQKKSVVVEASLKTDFNNILEVTEGMDAAKVYSKAQGNIQGANAGNFIVDTLYPPSAYDFEMFTYKYMTKGKEGENQAKFFKDKLFTPYEEAVQAIDKQKKEIKDNYSALVKELPQVEKNLNANIEGTNYSSEQAVRVYIWSKQGVEIPGISKRDQKALVAAVSADSELVMFADRLSAIAQQKEGYVKPTEYWTIESIAYDLADITGSEGRAKHLALWKENVSEIFSEENKSKLKVLYGERHVEALEDMLYRMEYGRNKNRPGRVEQEWNNWVNNSVGAVMFFNMRSAALQTISAVNYIDWENNHPGNAALAFANQPQFWKDFSTIYNSDYLIERRSGSKRTVNEAELVAHLKGKTNKAKAALAWLLEKGFTPTQIADSFAIASGGASFYRNQIKAYEKEGMTIEDAETQAFLDLRDKTEKGQQSSRADMISQQQAGGLGRIILAFKNTPMQYNRIMIKALADIKNKRGSLKGNLSKVAYYGVVQSVIFNSLQTALFSALGDEDEWDNKKERVANGMIDGILGGMGLTGAVAATVKNGYLMYRKQKAKGFNADHARTVLAFANLSPTIGSKLRKLYGGIQTEAMNQGAIEEMGLTIENPAYAALANIVSATTNIPADRVVGKINNIILASSSETEAMDRIALLMGWNAWDLGIKNTKAKQINKQVKDRKKKEKKAFNFKKKMEFSKNEEDKNILKQKQERKEGKKVTCSYNTSKGRCGVAVVEGGTRCTIHQKVEQRKDGKKTQCTKIKSNKKRCGVITANKSGLCYYHD